MRIWEELYPLAFGTLSAAAFFIFNASFSLANYTDVLSALINVSAIAVGFLATAKSILVAVEDKSNIQALKDSGLYERINDFQFAAIKWCFLSAMVGAVALLIDPQQEGSLCVMLMTLIVFLAVTASAACYRTVRIFFLVLNAPE